MQENNDLLDDIDIETKTPDTGTNRQLFIGFVIGVIIQFFLWVLFFEGVEHISVWTGSIFKINSIGYAINLMTFLVYFGMMLGSSSFLLFGNGKNQPYFKLLPIGFLFSILAVFDIILWKVIKDNVSFSNAMSNAFPEIFGVILFYFIMLSGIALILKRKLWYVGLLFVLSGFILMGFIR